MAPLVGSVLRFSLTTLARSLARRGFVLWHNANKIIPVVNSGHMVYPGVGNKSKFFSASPL